jgi:UDP-N-acetylglucosamine acyltransferase
MAKIHPTAIVHPEAKLDDSVEIGAFCIVERSVQMGPGCVLRSHSIVRRHTTLGENNYIDSFCVLGGVPQDLKFSPDTVSYLRVGNNNVFREHVTLNRATTPEGATTIGDGGYWMAASHAGHDAKAGNRVILANGAMLAGHSAIEDNVILSGGAKVHQFTWVGERAIVQGNGGVAQHLPPFCLSADINRLVGLNSVGLSRAPEITPEDRTQVKEAFHIAYRRGLPMNRALEEMDAHEEWGTAARKFREFVRRALSAEKPFARGVMSLRKG